MKMSLQQAQIQPNLPTFKPIELSWVARRLLKLFVSQIQKENQGMNFLSEIMSALPAILGAVVGIEATVKAPGATKKAIIMNSIDIAAKAGEGIPVPLVSIISGVIDSAVTELNKAGIFGRSANPVPVPIK
jgi:hypothetical protein